jgi:hypothetical protein
MTDATLLNPDAAPRERQRCYRRRWRRGFSDSAAGVEHIAAELARADQFGDLGRPVR